MYRFIRVGTHSAGQGPDWPLEAVGPANDCGNGAAVESLGQSVTSCVAL